jgi:hypothetical protein
MDLLTPPRMAVVTFAPHTTDIFQFRDLALFAIFKREGKYLYLSTIP